MKIMQRKQVTYASRFDSKLCLCFSKERKTFHITSSLDTLNEPSISIRMDDSESRFTTWLIYVALKHKNTQWEHNKESYAPWAVLA